MNYMIIRFDFSDEMEKLEELIETYLKEHSREDSYRYASDKYDMMRLANNWMDD